MREREICIFICGIFVGENFRYNLIINIPTLANFGGGSNGRYGIEIQSLIHPLL
jgi:hypothetical protein